MSKEKLAKQYREWRRKPYELQQQLSDYESVLQWYAERGGYWVDDTTTPWRYLPLKQKAKAVLEKYRGEKG